MDSRFKVEVVSFTPNPQQIAYAAMHQDYAEEFVLDDRDRWPDEAKAGELIVKYLLQGGRGHYGPLEHPQIILNFGYFPHSVMQQMRTHRNVSFDVQCLAADTEITFDDPVKLDSHSKETIGELYKLWAAGETAVRDRMRKMPLRVLNEDTGRFEVSHLKNILCSGIQSIYRLSLTDGKTLDCTINHRLFTVKGWQTMANAVELVTDDQGNVLNFKKTCEVMCNGVVLDKLISQNLIEEGQVTHVVSPLPNPPLSKGREPNPGLAVLPSPYEGEGVGVRFATQNATFQIAPPYVNSQPCQSQSLIAHPVQIINVEYLGLQMTYDLEVEDPWHNFVANGIVVHNSFRYTGSRIIEVVEGKLDLEEVFYLRPVGAYNDRQGKKYEYTAAQRQEDLAWCLEGCKRYAERIQQGLSEEHARGLIPFDVRQHWVMSGNARSIMHLLDIRGKFDVQMETRVMTEMMFEKFQEWMPEISAWYEKNRWRKGTLAP
jgi:thymidylate synthase (FAD)